MGSCGATRLDPHPHHTSPFLLLAPLEGRSMGLRFVFLLFPTLALAQDRYQTDLQDQYQNDPYQAGGYQTGPYQEGPYQEPYNVPKPFAYQYGGVDSQGLESSKVENQGEDGVVREEYRVQLPDGRTQIVSYTADEEHGYQAEVRYEGEARPEVPEPNDYLGPEGQVRVRQYPKHTRQPYGRY